MPDVLTEVALHACVSWKMDMIIGCAHFGLRQQERHKQSHDEAPRRKEQEDAILRRAKQVFRRYLGVEQAV